MSTPIQTDTSHTVNTVEDSTVQQAQMNDLFAVHSQIDLFNAALKSKYLTQFSAFVQSVIAGRSDGTNPPQPPASYVVAFFTDPTTGPDSTGPNKNTQWPYPSQTGAPVCAMPPIPGVVHHSLGHGKIGVRLNGAFFSEQAGDTTPDGEEAPGTSADGVTGIFRKIASPFGSNAATGEVGGWFYLTRALMIALMVFGIASTSLRAQGTVTASCAPQPMAATASLGKVAIGQWACWMTADMVPVVMTPAKLYQAIITAGKISPVTPALATQMLNDSVGRLPQSKAVKIGQIGLALGGIAATVYTGNAQWSLIGGLVSQNAPKAISLIQNEIPTAAPFLGGQMTGPVTLLPGADMAPVTIFAMKVKASNLAPFTVHIP